MQIVKTCNWNVMFTFQFRKGVSVFSVFYAFLFCLVACDTTDIVKSKIAEDKGVMIMFYFKKSVAVVDILPIFFVCLRCIWLRVERLIIKSKSIILF